MNKLKLSIFSLAIAFSGHASSEKQAVKSGEKLDDKTAYSFNLKFSGDIAPEGPLSFGYDLKIETEAKFDREQFAKAFLVLTDAFSEASEDKQFEITKNFANFCSNLIETAFKTIHTIKSDMDISPLAVQIFSNTVKDEIVLKFFCKKLANELKNNTSKSS